MPSDHPWHERDIDWWVNEMEGELGKTGTLQSVISILERGGPGSVGTNADHMTDRHIKAVERCHKVEPVWFQLSDAHRRTLRCYYELRQLPQGVREELGKLAGVAVAYANDADNDHLVDACAKLHQRPTSWRTTEPGKAAMQVVGGYSDRARLAAAEAHQAWDVAVLAAAEHRAAEAEMRRGLRTRCA